MGKTQTVTKRKKSTAPEVTDATVEDEDAFEELEDDEDEDTTVEDDTDELEDEDDEDETPAPTKKKAKADKPAKAKPEPKAKPAGSEYSSSWLASHVTEVTGEAYDARAVRMLLRKMAKDGTLPRVVGEDRDRYIFPEGPNSAIVKAVIALVKSGEATKIKRAGLDKVKADSDAKKKAKAEAKAKAAEEADEDVEDEDDEPAPVKKTKKTKTAAAGPAKAKPSGRKRAEA